MMSWNTSTDCCNWNGVTCDHSTGDVIGLDVNCGMLQGTIHPNSSLFNLPHLQKLNLAFNELKGVQIPSEVVRFSNSLTHLNLSHCWFFGQVPPEITLLHKLVSLDLSYNAYFLKLTPDVFINMFQNFTNLEELSLEGVNISLVLPTSLNISSSMKLLNLGSTRLQGKLPHSIFSIHSLETLNMGDNQFTGDIPSKILWNLTHLTYMRLSYNRLNGTLPSWLFTSPSLEYLALRDNMFSGNVPFESFALPSLKVLYLNYNQLAGHIDVQTFPQLTKLTVLYLSSNNFSGEWQLDTVLSSLTNLESLDLSYSGLPQFQSYGLQQLYLESNLIQGPFPSSICNMSNLKYLDMSNNRFGGLIPECFGKLSSSLVSIDMGNNSFQGTIPTIYDGCENLLGLILKGNQLEGEVPSSWSKCQSLKVVDFGNNHLNGTFPGWLGDLPNLQALVLKSNNFHGHIQPSVTVDSPFPSLRVLDLSHNRFVGQLPAKYFQNFNSMKNMVKDNTRPEYLMVAGTYYSLVAAVKGVNQEFPQILVDYTIIDLSCNIFEGHIPNVIGGLNSLIVLNLSRNSLIGPIPHALGNLTEIESLDLSWNQLSGEIPQSLAGIKYLAVLNLSQNHLAGSIPQGTQFNTFDEYSFADNLGLCGFPLPEKCSESHKPQLESHERHEEESGFTWEVVTLGYGCGTLLGLVMGYLMLSTRRVKWFNVIADAGEHMILKRNKRRYVFIGK
ncbi:leucine-rich repeat-containing protein [Tanacetum coccineum]